MALRCEVCLMYLKPYQFSWRCNGKSITFREKLLYFV